MLGYLLEDGGGSGGGSSAPTFYDYIAEGNRPNFTFIGPGGSRNPSCNYVASENRVWMWNLNSYVANVEPSGNCGFVQDTWIDVTNFDTLEITGNGNSGQNGNLYFYLEFMDGRPTVTLSISATWSDNYFFTIPNQLINVKSYSGFARLRIFGYHLAGGNTGFMVNLTKLVFNGSPKSLDYNIKAGTANKNGTNAVSVNCGFRPTYVVVADLTSGGHVYAFKDGDTNMRDCNYSNTFYDITSTTRFTINDNGFTWATPSTAGSGYFRYWAFSGKE